MSHTLFYDDHEKIVKNRAYSYFVDNTGTKKSILNYANVGATSLLTTVEDLSLWLTNFSNIKIGDSTIINKMNKLAVLNNGETFGGALGQFVGQYKGLNEIQHGGADAGYRSYLTRFPDENFSVIVLSNSAELNASSTAHKVVDIYLKDKLEKEAVKEGKSTKTDFVVSADILSTYVGNFELPGFEIEITESNGQLYGTPAGVAGALLIPSSTTKFKVDGVEATVEFIPNGGENIKSFKLSQNGQTMEAVRANIFDKTAVNLSDFSGEFYSEELSTTYSFTMVDGKLTAKHSRLSDFGLDLIKEDVFRSDAWFFGQVEFVRDTDSIITGFKVSTGRVKNLYFKKIN
jgi:hypothetical protein